MYKVMIVDDEIIIVDGLTKIVPWEQYNCRVAGFAHDSSSCKEKIREISPDILFTDIRMPGESGLAMLASLKSEFPNLQVTVLTGYRDFYYAQEAIKLGVTRFLLKPSKMEEIEEALSAMVENLKKSGASSVERQELPPSDAAGSFIVRQAVAYIEEHCVEKISLSDVAEKCYVSQWHLSKLLNKFANQNFYDILNGARISIAKKLLSDASLRISDIAEMVGYIDTAHFSKIFKKIEGISANEYRNRMKVKE